MLPTNFAIVRFSAFVLFLLHASAAAPTADAQAACAAIKTAHPAELAYPTDPAFAGGRAYWSDTARDAGTPACIFFPTSAQAVGDGVTALLKYSSVPFAMKSGGHSPNPGHNNVDGGVLFAFSGMAGTVISSDRETAEVGPGARWQEAITALEPYGKAVVGGRVGEVGVGGYLIGGGISYLSAQYGFGCDNVVNFEVVLANATIVNANATSNSDLFVALKGGGNQFGMVTKYTLRTVPIGQVWGGVRYYGASKIPAIINATADFASNLPDPKAALIPVVEYILTKRAEQAIVYFFYDGPTPPPGVFDAFNALKPEIDTVRTRSYSDLLTSVNAAANVPPRTIFYDNTYPSLPGDDGRTAMQTQYTQFTDQMKSLDAVLHGLIDASLTFQPFSRSYLENGRARGGANAIALDPREGDKILALYQPVTVLKGQDAYARKTAQGLVDKFTQYYQNSFGGKVASHADPGVVGRQDPKYLNDAYADQLVVQGYADYAQLKATQGRYDPDGFFSKRTQGFKY